LATDKGWKKKTLRGGVETKGNSNTRKAAYGGGGRTYLPAWGNGEKVSRVSKIEQFSMFQE